jgi:hypothetical protein
MAVRAYLERELTEPIALCGPDGRLNRAAVGWSRHPLHRCNLPASLARKKKWNYWAITSEDFLFSTTVADMDLFQLGGAYLFDRRTHLHLDKTVVCPAGTIVMPEGVAGDIVIAHPKMRVALTDEGAGTRIRVEAADFAGAPLEADIVVDRPAGHQTLNVVIPWSDAQFQFTSKQNTLPATGYVRFGDQRWDFAPPSFGCLDYGRGVWPEETAWIWGAASGVQGPHTVGLNLGAKWTDGTGMNENGICIDGRLTKISEDLSVEYDATQRMRPWRIRTAASDRIDLRFEPEFERISESGTPERYMNVHQMFGRYVGRISTGDGPLEVRGLFGWIEDQEARW